MIRCPTRRWNRIKSTDARRGSCDARGTFGRVTALPYGRAATRASAGASRRTRIGRVRTRGARLSRRKFCAHAGASTMRDGAHECAYAWRVVRYCTVRYGRVPRCDALCRRKSLPHREPLQWNHILRSKVSSVYNNVSSY